MANNPTWKGSREIHEAPGSPRTVVTASGERVTREFAGPYTALVAARPAVGQEMEGTPGVYVESTDVLADRAGPAGPGKLVVVLTNQNAGGGEQPENTQPTYEMEWVDVEKPLQQHPIYNGDGFGGAKITDEITYDGTAGTPVVHLLDEILKASNAKGRIDILTKVNAASINHRNLLYHIAAKMARGQRSYLVPAPVARRRSLSYSAPATSGQGTIETPPAATGRPLGYVWLKTADRALRQGGAGKWERLEEWTGADEWDTDFYD